MFNGYGEEVAQLYAGMDLREVLLMRALVDAVNGALRRVPVWPF